MIAASSTPTFRIPAPASPDADESPWPSRPAQPRPRRRPTRATYLRRRIVAAIVVIVAAIGLVVFGEAMMAEAGGGAASTGGHAVVEPGQTLWEVAASNAPEGTDTRAYLQDLKELNGLAGGEVAAWTVVLLPR